MKRLLLVYLICLIAAGIYGWLRFTHAVGVPATTDVPHIIFGALLLVMVLGILVGARLLWIKTRHPAALIQLITSSIVFALGVVEEAAKYLSDTQKPQLYDFLRRPTIEFALQIVISLCFLTFPAAYVWYAHSQKHI